mmetsp:Transcript_46319/g.116642  ORF Transcript_46319/g.116642 Transcript_46319/m.116642 type:complete len:127 (-) Transcript_46319:25-405(-)
MNPTVLVVVALVGALFVFANADGACNNDADLAVFVKVNNTFHKTMQTCAVKSFGDGDKAAACLIKETGLSTGCGGCFGADVTCSAKNCASKCMFAPDSQACLDCVKSNCLPGLLKCTGVSEDKLPH